MYEQYLRDPASVGDEWRQLFDNGKVAELPVIPTSREEVLRETGKGKGEREAAEAPAIPLSPVPRSEERRVGKERSCRRVEDVHRKETPQLRYGDCINRTYASSHERDV